MNTASTLTPQQLRPLVHEKIDLLTDAEVAAVHKQLVVLELWRELDAIGEEMANHWNEGRITAEKVDEAVREYRAGQRTPGSP